MARRVRNEKPSNPILARPLPDLRREWWWPAAVFVLLLAVYAWSMPRTVTLEDSGLFLMSCHTAGVSHPPGYPLHSLIGKLFTLLPIGSVAVRVHLVSAVFGALTAAVVWWIARVLTGNVAAAIAAGLTLGLSREFWGQSIIAEVYSLNTFFFFLLFAVALAYRVDGRERWLTWLGPLYGLSLANHWPLIVLSTPALALLLWPRRQRVVSAWKTWAPAAAVAAALPYAYLVVRSLTDPAISFIGPLDSFDRALYFVLRKAYSESDANPMAGSIDKLLFLEFFGRQMLAQLTPLWALAAAAGLISSWRRWPREIFAAALAAFVANGLLLILLLKRDFTLLESAVFKVYPLISYGVMALWIAAALGSLAERLAGRSAGWRFAAPAAGLALTAAGLVANAPVNDRHRYVWARDYAQTVLESLAPNAVLLTHGDADTGAIGYLHHVEGMRPDVTLYNDQGLIFGDRLFRPPTSAKARAQAVIDFVKKSDRPVYYFDDLDLPWGKEKTALFHRVDKASPKGAERTAIDPRQRDYCRRIAAQTDTTDLWTVDHRSALVGNCGRVLTKALGAARDPATVEALSAVTRTFAGKVGHVDVLAENGDARALKAVLDDASAQIDGLIPDALLARFHYLRGFLRYKLGEKDEALADFLRSIELHPSRDNSAVLNALQIHAMRGERKTYRETRLRYYGRDASPELADADRMAGF